MRLLRRLLLLRTVLLGFVNVVVVAAVDPILRILLVVAVVAVVGLCCVYGCVCDVWMRGRKARNFPRAHAPILFSFVC